MKVETKVQLRQHLYQKEQDEGFTLIELLVVIIIIGILSAIAMPSFLSQSNKARQSEAKTNIGAMNRAQQAYYFEQQVFATDITDLKLGISNSESYSYSANSTDPANKIANLASSAEIDLKGYTGGVFKSMSNETTQVILCVANTAGYGAPGVPVNVSNCAVNSIRVH